MSTASFILFPLFIARLGGDELLIGQVMGIGAAAAVLTRPLAGHWLDRHGGRRVLLVASAVNVVSIAALLLLDGFSLRLELLFVVHTIAAGALFASYFTYAAHIVPLARRNEGVAMFGVAGMLPNGLAPPLGEFLIGRFGFAAFFASAASFSLASLTLTYFLVDVRDDAEEHAHAARERREHGAGGVAARIRALLARGEAAIDHGTSAQPVRRRVRSLRLALRPELRAVLGATLCFGFGIAALFTFLAPYAEATGRGPVGPFFLGYALAAIMTRIVGARLPDRIGPRRVVMPAFLAYGVGLALVTSSSLPGALIAVGLICGAGHGYIFPILSVLVVARTPASARGKAMGLYTAMVDLGTMVGGPVLGAVARVGYPEMYLVAAGVTWLALVLLAWFDEPGLVGEFD